MTNQMDRLFAALADPTRRAVIEALADGPAPVTALAAAHDLALPTFLRHISVLEAAGLVATRKAGRRRMVALRPRALDDVEAWVDGQKALWAGKRTRLEVAARRLEDKSAPLPSDW